MKTDSLRKKVKAMQTLYGYTNEQVGARLKVSGRSYSRKLKDISAMKVSDLLELERLFHTKFINTEFPGQ